MEIRTIIEPILASNLYCPWMVMMGYYCFDYKCYSRWMDGIETL
ncbi:MAG: hypothetical protein ACFFAN_19400 [Promethearchaeota archaeon]